MRGMSARRARKGRHLQRDAAQAVVEVLGGSHRAPTIGAQVAMRRADDARIDADRLHAADALEGGLLQHAEQRHLRARRDVADLVEEERAAAGELEARRADELPRR